MAVNRLFMALLMIMAILNGVTSVAMEPPRGMVAARLVEGGIDPAQAYALLAAPGITERADIILNNMFHSSPKEGRTRSGVCLLYTSPSPRDRTRSRMPSSA